MRTTTFLVIASFLASRQFTAAQTSLYLPDFDPQPVTADELGVGPDGQTTWLIAPGVSSAGLDDWGFYGPATLVEGPSEAHLIYIDNSIGVSLQEDCTISNGIAACTAVDADLLPGGPTETDFITETASPMEVQGGGAAMIVTAGSQPTPSSQASSGLTPTSGPAATGAPTDGSQAASSSGSSTTDAPSAATSLPSSASSATTSKQTTSNQNANGALSTRSATISLLGTVGMAISWLYL